MYLCLALTLALFTTVTSLILCHSSQSLNSHFLFRPGFQTTSQSPISTWLCFSHFKSQFVSIRLYLIHLCLLRFGYVLSLTITIIFTMLELGQRTPPPNLEKSKVFFFLDPATHYKVAAFLLLPRPGYYIPLYHTYLKIVLGFNNVCDHKGILIFFFIHPNHYKRKAINFWTLKLYPPITKWLVANFILMTESPFRNLRTKYEQRMNLLQM